MKHIKVIILCICFFVLSGCNMQDEYRTQDIAEYRNFSGHLEMEESDLFSGVLIFPETISEQMEDVIYVYECGSLVLDNNYFIYLECVFDKEEFEKEAERIKKLSVTYNGETKNIIPEENAFEYPAYVSVYDEELLHMEYVLLNESEGKMVYVYSQLNPDSDEKIAQEYRKKENVDFENAVLNDGYNMYFFEEGKDMGLYVK